jgi:hypothetical protein
MKAKKQVHESKDATHEQSKAPLTNGSWAINGDRRLAIILSIVA